MSNKTEYSRMLLKRTTQSGATPTINTGATIDNTWLDTDILNGEMYANVEDDNVWLRTNNGLLEFVTQTTGSTLADLYLPLSGGSMGTGATISSDNGGGQLQLDFAPDTVVITTDNGALGESYIYVSPTEMYLNTDDLYVTSNNLSLGGGTSIDATTDLLKIKTTYDRYTGLPTGSIDGEILFGDNRTVNLDFNGDRDQTPLVLSSKNAYVASGVTNSVILGGNGINATSNDTVYTPDLRIQNGKTIASANGGTFVSFDIAGSNSFVTSNSGFTVSSVIVGNKYLITSTDTGSGIITLDAGKTINVGGVAATTTNVNINAPSGVTVNGDMNFQSSKGISFGSGSSRVFSEINIGDWNMDATGVVTVAHGLSATEWKTIRQIDVIIRNDADSLYGPLVQPNSSFYNGRIGSFDSTSFSLDRETGGLFDNTSYDSTSYNRGWITFWYTPDA